MPLTNIINMRVEPKRIRRQYRKLPITVTFEPATKEWKWEVKYTVERVFDGRAETMEKAMKAAQKTIDQVKSV